MLFPNYLILTITFLLIKSATQQNIYQHKPRPPTTIGEKIIPAPFITIYPDWKYSNFSLSYQNAKKGLFLPPPPSCSKFKDAELYDLSLGTKPIYNFIYWPSVINSQSFTKTRVWKNTYYTNHSRRIGKYKILKKDPFFDTTYWATNDNDEVIGLLLLCFIILYLILVLIGIFIIIPITGLIFRLLYMIYFPIAKFLKKIARLFYIWYLKLSIRLEILRTPHKYKPAPLGPFPKFLRNYPSETLPKELENFQERLLTKNKRPSSEVEISVRFAKYMEEKGLFYDPYIKRFRLINAKPENKEEGAKEIKKRKEEEIRLAREALAHEKDYITNIPKYRKTAIELRIPFAEDLDRADILETIIKSESGLVGKKSEKKKEKKILEPPQYTASKQELAKATKSKT